MKSTFDKKATEATFKIALDNAEWEAEINDAYNRTKKRYKIPGFRPGKAPRKYIEMHYGAGVFFDAAVDACINRIYGEETDKHSELRVFGQPDVAFDKPEDGYAFAFTLTVSLYPDAKLGEYKGIKLRKIEYNVSDGDLTDRIDQDLKHAARLVTVDRAAKNGDTVTIDFVGTVDGVEFEGGKAEGHELKLGSNSFIPGFEDQLIGVKAGEERDVKVKFPEDYHAENLKGKDAVFHVTAHEVRVEEVPALDDEFVKSHTKYETVDAYKTGLKADLEKAAADRQRNERIDAVVAAVVDRAECEIPAKIVDAEIDRMFHEMEHNLSHYGIGVDDYLKYNKSSVAQFRSERRESAERNVKTREVMRAIIDAEKLEVTDEEVQKKFDSDEAFRKQCEHEEHHHGASAVAVAKNDLLLDKFFDLLLSNNEFILDEDSKDVADKPAKKTAAKKSDTTEKSETAKAPAAKKTATKKADAADKTASEKKPAAKKTTAKKTEESADK